MEKVWQQSKQKRGGTQKEVKCLRGYATVKSLGTTDLKQTEASY